MRLVSKQFCSLGHVFAHRDLEGASLFAGTAVDAVASVGIEGGVVGPDGVAVTGFLQNVGILGHVGYVDILGAGEAVIAIHAPILLQLTAGMEKDFGIILFFGGGFFVYFFKKEKYNKSL